MSQSQPLAQIAPEANNVRAAWDWALARGRLEDLERILDPLADFCRLCGWVREGETLFSRPRSRWPGPVSSAPGSCLEGPASARALYQSAWE